MNQASVIDFESRRKTAASKARVAEYARGGIRKLHDVEKAAEREAEHKHAQSRACLDLETAIRKMYAIYGGSALSWIDLVHTEVIGSRKPDMGNEIERGEHAARGRAVIAKGLEMVRDAKGADEAISTLRQTLAAIEG